MIILMIIANGIACLVLAGLVLASRAMDAFVDIYSPGEQTDER